MSAIFPSAVATTAQMLVAINNTKVLLDVNAGIGDTTITVDDASPLSTSGYLTFNDDEDNPETISYTGKSGNDLTGVTRGADGTAAAVHTANGTTAIEMRWNAAYHNTLSVELIAVEQNLSDRIGLSASQILAPAGAVGAPSYSKTGDTNTGIYFTGADAIDIATGGVRAVGVNSSQQLLLPKTSSQVILGTTNTTTISATAPASSAVYTIPDVGTTGNFILSTGAQTITGAKTFASSALLLQEVSSTDVVTIAVASLATSRTYTVIDAGGAASFVMTAGTQTIAGAITFSTNDVTLTGAGKGIVVTTPDGTHTYRLAIDNSGQFTTELVS